MLNVLLADDSDMLRDRLRELICDVPGVTVVGEADSGPSAVETLDRLKPDVLILDIRMPGGDGIDALRVAKERHPCLMVIILTNYSYPQYRERCLEAGATYFFDKTAEFERVADVLTELGSNLEHGALQEGEENRREAA
jgi:DNA-binding NarL/FixJ family response regulator